MCEVKYMTYKIKPTSTKQRKQALGDYIIVINKNVKLHEKLGKYAAVKYLFVNNKNDIVEYRTMSTFGKIVVDDSLGDDEIAIDQSIRNAIGIPVGSLEGVEVKLAPIKTTVYQKIFDKFHKGDYHFARVHKPDVIDIEKNFCRMKGDSIHVMGALEGKSIIIERAISKLKIKTNEVMEKMAQKNAADSLQMLSTYQGELEKIQLDKSLKSVVERLVSNSEIENSYNAVESILSIENCDEDTKRIFLNNVFELWDWEITTEYKKTSLKVPVYTLQEESIKRIETVKGNQSEISFYTRYPDSEKIFQVNPDINGIYLDKYYRDLIHCNLLDSVKIKKNRIANIFNEIMEYGIMFVMSVVATIMTFNGENNKESMIALLVSLVITGIFIKIRTK